MAQATAGRFAHRAVGCANATAEIRRPLCRARSEVVAAAVRSSDIVVSGGGGLLQTATSLRSLMYYVGIIREAQVANCAAAIFAQGVGPLDFIGKQIVRRTCWDINWHASETRPAQRCDHALAAGSMSA